MPLPLQTDSLCLSEFPLTISSRLSPALLHSPSPRLFEPDAAGSILNEMLLPHASVLIYIYGLCC